MKQRTEWIWQTEGKPGHWIKVGIIYNKSKGNSLDTIRINVKGTNGEFDWHMRYDEALYIAAGLMKTLSIVVAGMGKAGFVLEDFYKAFFDKEE